MFKIKKKYHFVGACPRCNSYKTGYVIRARSETLCNKLMYSGLINGELIEAELGFGSSDIDNNLFCRDCGARWYGEIEIKYLTLDERLEQRQKRDIDEETIKNYGLLTLNPFERRQAIKIINKEKKKMKKIQEKQAIKQTKIKESNIKIKK